MHTQDLGRTKNISILISIQTKQLSISILTVVRNNQSCLHILNFESITFTDNGTILETAHRIRMIVCLTFHSLSLSFYSSMYS